MGFCALSLTAKLVQTLDELGYQTPTPIQSLAIPLVLAGEDVMARAQTGTGKTAAFALPMIQLLDNQQHQADVRALVLVPTRELAQQVYKAIQRYAQHTQLGVEAVYGGVSINPQIAAIKRGVDIMVATPGRLLDHLINGSLSLKKLQMLVFDEADRMLDMGFKDEIDRLLKRIPKNRQTLLFSATFDDGIYNLSKQLLNDPKRIAVDEGNVAAVEVKQSIYAVDKNRKPEFISYLIGSKNYQQVLIFVRTKQGAEALAAHMRLDGIDCQSIHGDKSQGARDRALTDFKQGKCRALIATDVASRGIDIRELKYVINFELPYNAEDYVHRIGRTGRAGEAGTAISLMSQDEAPLLEAIEKLLDTRLTAQWFPGYEPDLSQLDSGRAKDKAKAKAKGKERGNEGRKRQMRKGAARRKR